MASFKSVLQVKGRQYTVLYSDFDIHQFTDSLGRPASPTFGGVYTLDVESPPSGDSTLFEWMVEPTLFLNGQVLIKNLTGTTLKVIKFYNAYCVDLEQHFDGTGRSGDQSSLRLSLRISPQAVKVGEQFHDNDWPAPEPIVDWHWADMDAACNLQPQPAPKPKPKPKPGLVGPTLTLPPTQPKPRPAPPHRKPPGKIEPAPQGKGFPRPPLIFRAAVWLWALLSPHPAGEESGSEWVMSLPPEDEQRWAELDKKRQQLAKEGKVLPAHEYEEWLALDERKFPHGRDNKGLRPHKGTVQRNKLDPHEYEQATHVTDEFGGEFVGQQDKNTPGIDGYYNGEPASLKEYSGTKPLGVLNHVSKAEAQAQKAGYRDVTVFVEAKGVSSDQLIEFAKRGGLKNIPSQGTVKEIFVETSDGWVKIGKDGISKLP